MASPVAAGVPPAVEGWHPAARISAPVFQHADDVWLSFRRAGRHVSSSGGDARRCRRCHVWLFTHFNRARWLCVALVFLLGGWNAFAQTNGPAPPPSQAEFAKRAEKAWQAAKARFDAQTNNAEAAWQFGRACFDWADFATSDRQREDIAQQGIAACQTLVQRDPKSAPGHYYLGMDLAQLAQTKTLGALKIVGQMENEFTISLDLDAAFDNGGSDRNLGLLYRDAPGWPLSIGSRAKARQHLQQALKLAPDDPENSLNLIEAELQWGDRNDAARDLKRLDELWPKAREKFAGEDWESSWVDWTTRRERARKKMSEPAPIRPTGKQ
jgi:tetratricopeptide (TPR) repeat protein